MPATIRRATEADAAAVASVLTAAAEDLTARYGEGPWSHLVTEAAAARAISSSVVLVALDEGTVVGTLRLTTRKPWAIDAGYFAPVKRAIYLLDMSVAPSHQRMGVGRQLLAVARDVARGWPGQSLRLDAYDADAGAGGFYARCGYREVGRVVYRGTPLLYFELLLEPLEAEA